MAKAFTKASKAAAPTVRCFDLREELRSTASRRKRAANGSPASTPFEGGDAGAEAEELSTDLSRMFPALPPETVLAVVTQLLHMEDAALSRKRLAERAVDALLEISFASEAPHTVTSLEPPATHEEAEHGENGEPEVLPEPASGPVDGRDSWEELLDERVASLLALPNDELLPCVQTLASILERIAEEPGNTRVRRMRFGNARFHATVGRHAAAVALLHHAGFEDDADEIGGERAVAFWGDSVASSTYFGRVREVLHGLVEDLGVSSARSDAVARSRCADSAQPRAQPEQQQQQLLEARSQRRQRILELTEARLTDPRGFRQRAEARGRVNQAIGTTRPAPTTNSLSRRAQHFTLADVERLRIADEIASTPSYAEEYRRQRQGGPARDYSTLVSRSYDPELISRQALDGTNKYRASKGLAPCLWHSGIARIAAEHAAQMASGAAPFSHDGFNIRVQAFPVSHCLSAAENLALNAGLADVAEAAVQGWIRSPGHERNLSGKYNLCGIGTARSANGTFYVTQLFALVQ